MAKVKLNVSEGLQGAIWLSKPYQWDRRHPVHRHEELEANLVLRGTGRYMVGDQRFEMAPATLIWLFPGQDHVLIHESDDFAMWIVVLRRKWIQQHCTTEQAEVLAKRDPKRVFCDRIAPVRHRNLIELFEQVQGQRDDPALYNAGLAWLMLRLWQATCTAEDATEAVEVHPAVERAIYMLRDESQSPGIEQLAAQCGLSSSRLSRLFGQQVGMSIPQYINRQRIERLIEIYGQGRRHNMLSAAYEAGFGSYAQFYRVFRQTMGMTPAAYQRHMRDAPDHRLGSGS